MGKNSGMLSIRTDFDSITGNLKNMEQDIKRYCPKLDTEMIVFDKSLEQSADYFKNKYNPNLLIVGERGQQMKYLTV